ncbi:RNA-directed DNA polymerase, eukaryota [Tanacetum coccineum]
MGHRSNNYSESKRNDHLDNNRRQEQRNKGIPNKSHPNFCEEHKSFSSIFVSNIPWNASVQDLWDICNKWGVVIDVYIAAKRSKSGHRFGFVRFINVNDINQLVSNLRTTWMGGFHLFTDVAKYGRTYNRPVERPGEDKPSVGLNSQSVSINENIFQSFNSYGYAVPGQQISGTVRKIRYSNAGAGICGGFAIRSILAKVKDLSVISELLKHMSSEGFNDVGLRYVGGRWVWLEFDSMDQGGKRQDFKPPWWVDMGIMGAPKRGDKRGFIRSWRVGGSSVFTDMGRLQRVLCLDGKFENEEHLDVDSCDSDSPKNVNNDSVSPSSRVLREEDVRGVESDLDCMEKNLEDDAGEILGVHSQGDCGNVTTDDNEDVTPVIAPEKDSIIAPPSTPPGHDLNIAVESGSSWIDYIGPLTSDEIDSDKRWSYRGPNGNIHGLFSLAQLRSWKDYFPSDLQIWSYYGNVKEAILLHNALSRQTKDAG